MRIHKPGNPPSMVRRLFNAANPQTPRTGPSTSRARVVTPAGRGEPAHPMAPRRPPTMGIPGGPGSLRASTSMPKPNPNRKPVAPGARGPRPMPKPNPRRRVPPKG